MKPLNKDQFIEELRKIFITVEIFNLRFSPIEKIVYSFIGLVLVAFATAIIALIIK